MNNDGLHFRRILFSSILLAIVLPSYFLLPKIMGEFIELGHDDIDLIKHFVLTIIAVTSVHLFDLFWLHKDTAREYSVLTKTISANLTQHVETLLERYKEEADTKYELSKQRNRLLVESQQNSSNAIRSEVTNLTRVLKELEERVNNLEGLLLRIHYLKVGENGVTEATIYQRAMDEVRKANDSIDVFTSYLLEGEDESDANRRARDEYFELLLTLCKESKIKEYRRIIQVEKEGHLEDAFRTKAESYLHHIYQMDQMEANHKNVHPRVIIQRRPTTYVIIDKQVLLWQINAVRSKGHMQMYAMFIVEDPRQVLINHFAAEFEPYFKGREADHPRFRMPH